MSKIEWTHRPGTKSEVLNPTTGCDKVSAGCRGCYAEVMHRRLTGMGQPKYQEPFLGHVRYWPDELAKPFKWKTQRTVFLNSMSDIFHADVTVQQIAEIYAMMCLTPRHTYIVLTKRAGRAYEILNSAEFLVEFNNAMNRLHDKYINRLSEALYFQEETDEMFPVKNVWQGVSVERQEEDHRIDHLSNTPAHVRVVSYEPAIGPLDMADKFGLYQVEEQGPWHLKVGARWKWSPDWVIAGGESGHNARPSHPEWFRTVRDQCKAAGVPFFFKQNGAWEPIDIHRLDQRSSSFGYFDESQNFHHVKRYVDLPTKINRNPWDKRVPMTKVGKHASGNYLDGVQHLEFPA